MPQSYVLGHSDREIARLERQAEIFAEPTRDVLGRAGLSAGMRVLDVGCGVGDVSMIAAGIVGASGSVTGVDAAEAPLAIAARRAAAAGHGSARFIRSDLADLDMGEPFDAVIGRFILLHLNDPAAGLRGLLRHLRPQGIVAFIEMDIGTSATVPPFPLFERCLSWITSVYARVGAEPNMGTKMYATFRACGLLPEMAGTCRIEAGPDAGAYDYMAQSIRSLAPAMERFGVATAEEIGVDTLADRLRCEAVAGDHCIIYPRLVGAWARRPPSV